MTFGSNDAAADGQDFQSGLKQSQTNTILTAILIIAALHFGQDVFLPLAIAMLVAFALSPLVTILRKSGLPMIAAVLAVVALACVVIAAFFLTVAGQIGNLAEDLPTFQANIVAKLEKLQSSGSENGLVYRITSMISAISAGEHSP